MRIGINGFGRIGKCILRAIFEQGFDALENINFIQINSSAPVNTIIHLLKYDSTHGKFKYGINKISDNELKINSTTILLTSFREQCSISWENVDILMDCTGLMKTQEDANPHIKNGAQKIVISAPIKDHINIPTLVLGANQINLKKAKVVSIGSCTTNCLAPLAKIIHDQFTIEKGSVTTIHSYTNDQNNIDSKHKDLRRARSCAESMIPTSTGAAKAISLVMPELNGKINGSCIRVPTSNVSLIDCSFVLSKSTTVEEFNQTIERNSGKIVGFTDEPLVSIDFIHNSHSVIFDSLETKITQGNLVRCLGWYDNEWAFSVRMLEVGFMMNKSS